MNIQNINIKQNNIIKVIFQDSKEEKLFCQIANDYNQKIKNTPKIYKRNPNVKLVKKIKKK